METITDKAGYVKAIMEDGIVVLEGIGKTCPNCRAIQPVVDELIKKYPNARFYQYDVEATDAVSQELRVTQMPSFHIFKDSVLEENFIGSKPDALRRAMIEVAGDK